MRLSSIFWQPLVLLITTLICYLCTLTVPFYLDDASSISNNIVLLSDTPQAIFNQYGLRTVGYLSFALNYRLGGLDVTGFHAVNILIHLMTGIFVWLLSRECCKAVGTETKWLPFITALIFVCHPLQTQAVTYIVQRLASLAALFYIAALYFYMRARTSLVSFKTAQFAFLSMLMAGLAFFTKQNTVVLPLAFLLIEVLILKSSWARNKAILAKTTLLFILLFVALYNVSPQFSDLIIWLDSYSRETAHISRLAYFETQLRVVGVYIQKFFWPVGLQLEYAIPIASGTFVRLTNYFWLHLALLSLAFVTRKKLPLVTFGILFYYTAHIVESSFIPIRDVAFEHRTYLPNFGLVLACVALFSFIFSGSKSSKQIGRAICGITVIGLISVTIERNLLWLNPIAFYQHELSISANKSRIHNALGQLYMEQQQWDLAIEHFEQAVVLNDSEKNEIQFYIGNYIAAIKNAGQVDFAIMLSKKYLPLMPTNEAKKLLLTNLGFMYFQKRDAGAAFKAFKQVMSLDNSPPPNEANIGFGLTLWALKRHKQAEFYLTKAVENDPTNEYAKLMLDKLVAQEF